MKRVVLIIALLPLCLCAQVVRQPLAMRYASLGAYSKNFTHLFSGASNQAALAQLKTSGFGAYGERRFMLQDLNQFSTIVVLPTSSGTFALQGDYFGSSALNESQLGLACGRQVSGSIDVGLKLNYHSLLVPGFINRSSINFEAGTIFHLTDQFHAGFHLYNPFSSQIGKTGDEKLPAVYKTGLGYEASKQVFVSAEIVKQQSQPVNVNAGFEYHVHESVLLRAGVSTGVNNSFAGVGFVLGSLRVDVNTAYHPQLGFTPGVLVLYNFKKAATP